MPQAQAFTADGQPIPEAELPQALADGRAGFEAEADVAVRDASGKPGVVKGAEVGQLLASGGSLETSATLAAAEAEAAKQAQLREHMGPLETYKAQVEGTFRGATFGQSDVLGAALLGPEYAEAARLRKEAHPLLAGGAELSGALGASVGAGLLTGGAGAVAGGARFAGAGGRVLQALSAPARLAAGAGRVAEGLVAGVPGFGGRIAGMAAQGAAEGALFDVGMEMSKAALEQRDLTADKLLAAAGHGALLGGTGGAVFGAAGAGLSAAGKAALKGMGEGSSLAESLSGFAQRRAVKSVTGNNQRIYNELTNFGQQPERLQRVGRKLIDRGIPLTNVDDGIRQVQAQLDDSVARLKGVAQTLDETGAKADVKTLLARVDDQIRALQETPLGSYADVAQRIKNEIAPLRRAAEGPAGVFRRGKDGTLTPVGGKQFGFSDLWKIRQKFDDTIKWSSRQQNPATDELKRLRATFEDTLEQTIEAQRPDLAPVWRGAKEDYRDFSTVSDALEELATRGEKNRWTSPSDYWSGGLAFLSAIASGGAALPSLVAGAATSYGHKLLREKGPGVVARIADALAKTDRRLAAGVAAAVDGKAGKALRVTKPVGLLTAALAEQVPEAPTVTAKGKDSERVLATLRLVREVQTDPVAASKRLGTSTAELAEWSPEIAEALNERVLRGAQFLHEKLPPMLSRQMTSLTPQLEKVRIPPMEMRRTLQYIEALDDPASVLDDLAQGKMPRAKIEALKAVAPDLFKDIRARVIRDLSERTEPVSYNRRILLSLAFDFVGDKSLDPAYMSRIQQTFSPTEEQEQPQPSGGVDVNADTFAGDLETETQRLATGA